MPSEDPSRSEPADLWWVAAATGVVIAIIAAAAFLYLLLDILLLLFLGIVVAAALQPWHLKLCNWGVPKGLAVLLIYLLFASGLVLVALVVGPQLIEGITYFAATLSDKYSSLRAGLANAPVPLRSLAQQLPSVERLGPALANVAPQFYESVIGLTTGAVAILTYLVTVLALAFYWTMELPRYERLILSFFPVGQRARTLVVWHEIEFKLGAFMRGQGLAMLIIGAASGVGYALIGLPNVLTLAVLAGLLEAVPLIGPVLASVPAVLVALPLGLHIVLLVIGLSISLQLTENYFLIPRIMAHTVGVSALVSLVAVLAFGALYGILGVFIAVPAAAVIQVVLESLMGTAAMAEPSGLASDPWSGLRVRVRALRAEARDRLRGRETRMGIDPATADHVVDAVDQQIEGAVERVETVIASVQDTAAPLSVGDQSLLGELEDATDRIALLVERNNVLGPNVDESPAGKDPEGEALADLSEATSAMERAVEQVETVVAETIGSEDATPKPRDVRS